MKILLSAFAFAPNVGSEAGVGWRWAIELAKNHRVTVITDATREAAVLSAGVILPDNLRVVYFRPRALKRIPLNSWTAQSLYALWQFWLLGKARQLHREEQFDMAIHTTYSVFRHPSFLGLLGIPFVFGPLGGGEDAPWKLKHSIKGRAKAKELLRSAVNSACLFDPFLWFALANSTLVVASTEDTRNALPWPFRRRAITYSNLGTDIVTNQPPSEREQESALRVIFAGRLIGMKGVHLALRAVALALRRGAKISFSIAGSGPLESHLKSISCELGFSENLSWLGYVDQKTLFSLYSQSHCFLFPSLHDSGGTVVLEAQSHGLPVICLDLGGPPTLVTEETSIVVPTRDASEETVVVRLADALMALWADETRRHAMSCAAINHAKSMSWANRVNGLIAIAEPLLKPAR